MATAILLSGGMDSMISRRLFYPDAIPVFVYSGSRYVDHDLEMAAKQAPDLQVFHMPKLQEWANGVVPHRNALLLAYVANRVRADTIVVSAPRGEMIWDQQPAFHRAMERVLRNVKIVNPLRRMTKAQAVAAMVRRYDLEDTALFLQDTRSCYDAEAGQCGQCAACVKRFIALTLNHLHEEYRYDVEEHAKTILAMANWRDALRYGVRPAYEAWKALREP